MARIAAAWICTAVLFAGCAGPGPETEGIHGAPASLAERVGAALREAKALSSGGDPAGAAALLEPLVEACETQGAEALLMEALSALGNAHLDRGDLENAGSHFNRALELAERIDPGSVNHAACLNDVGTIHDYHGEYAEAVRCYERSIAMLEGATDIDARMALGRVLNNLGGLRDTQGDLESAESIYRRALAIFEDQDPSSMYTAVLLNNIGILRDAREDTEGALEALSRALPILQEHIPNSLELAMVLNNIAGLERGTGDLDAALNRHLQALEIRRAVAPGSVDEAMSLNNLGTLHQMKGNLSEAEKYYQGARAIYENVAPQCLDAATVYFNLAQLPSGGGDVRQEEAYRLKALEIEERLAPDSMDAAMSLQGLALLTWRDGRPGEAVDYYERAIRALEAQMDRLGGSEEVRAGFSAQFGDIYREAVRLLHDVDRPGDAYAVMERARGRRLLALLAERDVVWEGALPPDLAAERAEMAAELEEIEGALFWSDPRADPEGVEELVRGRRELRDRWEDLRRRITEAAPHYASLRYPRPLDADGARDALDPGTLLMAYALTGDGIILFLVERGRPLEVHRLNLNHEALNRMVRIFRASLSRRGEVRDIAERLGRKLLEPAAERILEAKRVLVCPDGALHVIPFGALRLPGEGERRDAYLIEEKPVHVILSATLYAELKAGRAGRGDTGRIVAFGDPDYSPGAGAGGTAGAGAPEGGFEPLPHTRLEVAAIAGAGGGGSAVFLGAEATEERVYVHTPGASRVHFACHGVLDEAKPLESALALAARTGGAAEDGFLEAWEIFDRVRLEADLVVLSACETALGRDAGGEGVVGLTRAFQYAGARSVVASLWRVSDASTAALMQRFYVNLADDLSKDEALRQAQLSLLRAPLEVVSADGGTAAVDASHPFYWASFQLTGDWK